MDICIWITDSLCHTPETQHCKSAILQQKRKQNRKPKQTKTTHILSDFLLKRRNGFIQREAHSTQWAISKGAVLCDQLLSHVRFFAAPRTVASQAPLSMDYSRQEYWIGLLIPTPGNLTDS